MDTNKVTYDFSHGVTPFDEWRNEYNAIHELNYKDAILNGDLALEASLKDILYQAGFSDQNILALMEGALQTNYPKTFYRTRSTAKVADCTVYSYDEALAVLQGNIHAPFKKQKTDKKKKSADKSDDVSAAEVKTHWTDQVSSTDKKVTVPKVVQYHSDGVELVNLAKSSIIHYAMPGRKSSLCGKKHIGPVKPEHAQDPLYDVCAKCKIFFDASKVNS